MNEIKLVVVDTRVDQVSDVDTYYHKREDFV